MSVVVAGHEAVCAGGIHGRNDTTVGWASVGDEYEPYFAWNPPWSEYDAADLGWVRLGRGLNA
jgi:hypothetical protein